MSALRIVEGFNIAEHGELGVGQEHELRQIAAVPDWRKQRRIWRESARCSVRLENPSLP